MTNKMTALILSMTAAVVALPAGAMAEEGGSCNNYGNDVYVGTGDENCTAYYQYCEHHSGAGAGAGAGAGGGTGGNDPEAGATAETSSGCTNHAGDGGGDDEVVQAGDFQAAAILADDPARPPR